jgi:hypothetical protein
MRIQKKHCTFVLTDKDKDNLKYFPLQTKKLKSDIAVIRFALQHLADDIKQAKSEYISL